MEGADERYRSLTVGRILLDAMRHRVAQERGGRRRPVASVAAPPAPPPTDGKDVLGALDLGLKLTEKEYQRALEVNRNSSLSHYRVGEVFFLQANYQSAANEFREALNGDLEPKWTEVWARINLGKIFDITGQRERAVNEYNLAIRTKDNTQGAQEEAARYLKTPFERKI